MEDLAFTPRPEDKKKAKGFLIAGSIVAPHLAPSAAITYAGDTTNKTNRKLSGVAGQAGSISALIGSSVLFDRLNVQKENLAKWKSIPASVQAMPGAVSEVKALNRKIRNIRAGAWGLLGSTLAGSLVMHAGSRRKRKYDADIAAGRKEVEMFSNMTPGERENYRRVARKARNVADVYRDQI